MSHKPTDDFCTRLNASFKASFAPPAPLVRNDYGRNAHSHDVLPMLGIPAGGHLPPEGMPPRKIQGITVYVKPAAPSVQVARWGKLVTAKSSRHRVMCVCPLCAKHVSLGRLHQHIAIHATVTKE